MGQFSWITSDTEEQVFCEQPKDTYYLLVPEEFQNVFGTKWFKETKCRAVFYTRRTTRFL